MSDMITHWASFEDCRRLAQLDDGIEPLFRDLIENEQNAARLGTLTRLGKDWMPPILKRARAHADEGELQARDRRDLSFVLGGLIHQACDNVMKPILSDGVNWTQMQAYLRGTPGVPPVSPEQVAAAHELSAYLDAEVFRRVYMEGEVGMLSRFFLSELSPRGQDFEQFIRALFQRTLLSSHTLNPPVEEMDDWLDNLFSRLQPLYVDVEGWVRVYQNPDPAKIEAFDIRTRFYREDDPTIVAARALQAGQPIDDQLRQAVFVDHSSTCAYGEILQVGLRYLRGASQYWRGESDDLIAPNYEQWPDRASA
ncbi:hypothetical protein [Shinella sp.]|uniref:hypothetical protein n=1 Tax=Shinella sp. TaxID=1870904 RepID=UPI003F7309DD